MDKDLILIGMPGCGKSAMGKQLAKRLNREFADLDTEIEKDTDMTIPQIFEKYGEAGFRKTETRVFEKSLKGGRVIATGGGIVTVDKNREFAKKGCVLFIDRPLEKIFGDIDMEKRPLLADGKERLNKLYSQRYQLYLDWADIRVVNDTDFEDVIKSILNEVKCYENNGD